MKKEGTPRQGSGEGATVALKECNKLISVEVFKNLFPPFTESSALDVAPAKKRHRIMKLKNMVRWHKLQRVVIHGEPWYFLPEAGKA